MERQLINHGYIIALIALCRLKMELQLINQGNWSHGNGGPQASNFGPMVREDHRHQIMVTW